MTMAKRAKSRWLAALFAAIELFAVAAIMSTAIAPAQAQFRDDRYLFLERRRQQRPPGFFDRLFGPRYTPQQRDERYVPQQREHVDSARAPAPRKVEGTPTMTVMVMGDSMADWLGYGLEEAFTESPEIAVARKSKLHSGLLRYEARSDLDWWHVARDLLSKEKADFVVMMLGINDRQAIRETPADKKKAELDKKSDKDAKNDKDAKSDKSDNKPDSKADDKASTAQQQAATDDEGGEQPTIAAPEPRHAGSAEFRSERWEQLYVRRIDETIAALKSKGIPVLWVGLPPLRGTRSTADMQYLNDLFRARAEKAGIVYVDIWDGFIDENGRFTTFGPDFEGQTRRLRSADGVHFTKYGARKLAHYVERELRRFMANRSMPMVSVPDNQATPQAPAGPAQRPVAGPVISLTAPVGDTDDLLGGGATRPVHADPVASRVLVRGEPVAPSPGRADDFTWPRGANTGETLSPAAAAARAVPPVEPEPVPEAKAAPAGQKPSGKAAAKPSDKPPESRKTSKAEPKSESRSKPPARVHQQPRPQQRTQQQQRPSGGPFGWFR
jgi:hypothetical protein